MAGDQSVGSVLKPAAASMLAAEQRIDTYDMPVVRSLK